jgi:SAM-dependent methyltransferase
MIQDERAPFVQALQRARMSAYSPGEFVGQESFMLAGEIRALAGQAGIAPGVSVLDLCCGVAGPGRFITQELGCTYLGVDSSSSAISIARESAGDFPCRFEVSQIPPIPPGPFDVVLLLETMLAFPEKETLLQEISRALTTGGRFAFTMEEGQPLTEAERERMPDADTVWLTPLQEMLTCLERVGLVVRWQDDCSRSHRAVADSLIQRVCRRCYGHCRADRTPRTGGAPDRPPALERLAAGWKGPQDRFRGGEETHAMNVPSGGSALKSPISTTVPQGSKRGCENSVVRCSASEEPQRRRQPEGDQDREENPAEHRQSPGGKPSAAHGEHLGEEHAIEGAAHQ